MQKVKGEIIFHCTNQCDELYVCDGYSEKRVGGAIRCQNRVVIDGLARCKNKKVHEFLMLEKHKEYL